MFENMKFTLGTANIYGDIGKGKYFLLHEQSGEFLEGTEPRHAIIIYRWLF